ncbi:MAG: sigma-54-dependent Fis family transcriptional regulator, partial [Acidobacteria bacterium]|nr:sigma-54-dependent Fis family transcriptional regulator [Acidobacteriota bacterium]
MRAEDLDHKELLELNPDEGVIRFAGQRALLIDAVAMGLLRKYLVENFGQVAARTVLTQFGFAHGWRMAEAMQAEFKWANDTERCQAGTRIHSLGGLFRVGSENRDPFSKEGMMIVASYEAEQHLLHFGRADAPMCWTICGLISGQLSHTYNKEVFVLEDRCQGKGDAGCHLYGRTREEWGNERAEELRFYEKGRLADCLDISLHRVTETLKAAERKLKEHRKALIQVAWSGEEPQLGIVAKSKAMRQLVDLARRVAKVDSTVLITGESGSGKERIARLIHEESTGATHDRPGLFESARGGTLLLDEVGEVSPGMQVKLLRTIQEREVRRVGENMNRKLDVRILAATNRDLAASVTSGTFRQDLYYRLKVVELIVPPLRERRDDVLPLARALMAGSALQMKRKITGLSPGATDQLLRHAWPGNVRELENAMERAVALAPGSRVELEDLPE